MKLKLFSALLLIIVVLSLLPFAGAVTVHCLRADVNREIYPSFTIDAPLGFATTLSDYNYLIPIGSTITYSGFGNYHFYCDDGASGATLNYVDLYDTTTGIIVATNGLNNGGPIPNPGGPINTSSPMCSNGPKSPCVIMNGIDVPPKGSCGTVLTMGMGGVDSVVLPLNENMFGPHILQLRLGTVSPGGVDKYDSVIWPVPKKTISVFVGTPNILVFGQQGLKRLNYYESSGSALETALFTISNKSKYIEVIDNYKINCTEGTSCSLDLDPTPTDPARLQYAGFRLLPGESMIIPARVTIDKTKIPYSFFSSLDLNYYVMADASHPIVDDNNNKLVFSTHSTQTKIESGLLDKQDFQISVIKNPVQRECISADGEPGVTGEEYAPKVNLYFGSNSPSTEATGSTVLISKDECTKTSDTDNSWVYCSQREFLVALAERISGAYGEMAVANSNEADNNLSGAQIHRANALALLNFDAHLRAQSITPAEITGSADAVSDQIFASTGLIHMNKNEFKNLSASIKFQKTSNGTIIEDTDLEPGLYTVTITTSDLSEVSSASELFKNDETVADGLSINASMEKKEDPKFDWFFYYDKNTDNFPQKISPAQNPNLFTTNVDARGTILTFEKGSDITGQFYKTVAIPIMAKISDRTGTGPTTNFKVPGYEADTFTYWTGIASNEPNKAGVVDGCTNPFTQKALPYRAADSKIASLGNFSMPEATGNKQNGIMYLQTVVYVPVLSGQLTISDAEFGLRWLGYSCDGNSTNKCGSTITNIVGNYPNTKVETLNEVFNGIKNGSICVFEDNSLSNPRWKVFWNQDKVLQGLNADRNAINDANLCITRQTFSS
ncbi:Uncharacterised protein [uncultured archaeon]|nr:Uncharacterised protein [uncultured archaeon]